MIGKKLSPILVEIENTIWESESNFGVKPEYTQDGFRASVKIFMSTLMDMMWELQDYENLSMEDRGAMAQKAGDDIKKLIKTYTNIDTTKLY